MTKPARKPQLLTKDQRAAIERELSVPHGRVKLKADGHELTLEVRQVKPLKFAVLVYVDGWIRGEWHKADSDIGAKFWRRRVHCAANQASLARHRKVVGKRMADRLKRDLTFVMHSADFPSGRACLASLQRTCDSIEVVSIGYRPTTEARDTAAQPEVAHG